MRVIWWILGCFVVGAVGAVSGWLVFLWCGITNSRVDEIGYPEDERAEEAGVSPMSVW